MNLMSFFLVFITSPPSSLTCSWWRWLLGSLKKCAHRFPHRAFCRWQKHSLIAVTWCEVQKHYWLNRCSIFYGILFCPFSFYIIGIITSYLKRNLSYQQSSLVNILFAAKMQEFRGKFHHLICGIYVFPAVITKLRKVPEKKMIFAV